MAKIRVIRVMEYTYSDMETMVIDMQHWHVQGTYRPHERLQIKSVVLSPDLIQEAYDNPLVPNVDRTD